MDRFLELVFGHPFRTPKKEEHAMFMAYASAARSAQLGRQVGAAIATPEGEVIAVGMNEVPSPRGGPYWEGDSDDCRDHKREVDSNYEHRDRIVQSVIRQLDSKLLTAENVFPIMQKVVSNLKPGADPSETEEVSRKQVDEVRPLLTDKSSAAKLVHDSDLREIPEYGRAIHGEMDAIINCARLGISIKGNHFFVTTFPSHNCTRHIVGAGIKKVYYIEPYSKSKAEDLHSDAICFDEAEAARTGKVPFLPFIGIGPRRYLDLFSLDLSSGRKIKRKADNGVPLSPIKTESAPRVPMLALSYLEREDKLLDEFKDVLQNLQGMNHGENRIEKPQLAEPDADTSAS